jgi:hypothetical protein
VLSISFFPECWVLCSNQYWTHIDTHSLHPSQNCLPPWCFNIMLSNFIEGLYKKEPHEAHFCIYCEIGMRTLSIKLLNVPYLRPTQELTLSLVPGKKKCAFLEKVVKLSSFLLVSYVTHCVSFLGGLCLWIPKNIWPVFMHNNTQWVRLRGL